MGCYQEGIAKDSVAGKDVTAHIFEYVPTCSHYLVVNRVHNHRHTQVYHKCHCDRVRRGFVRCLPSSDSFLP